MKKITLFLVALFVAVGAMAQTVIFKETFGISPHQYLTDCRINKAKLYLLQNEKSISEIAELTGFGCQQYFNKVFKKETGFTPASYRKNIHSDYLL